MAYGSPDPVGTCIDAHLLRAMNLDDNSEEGWDSYKEQGHLGVGPLKQMPLVPSPHFLVSVLRLRPLETGVKSQMI